VIDAIFQDLRNAVRSLRRSPGFVVAAVITFALGIGANSAMLTLADALLLRLLPVNRPGELVEVSATDTDGRVTHLLAPMLDAIREAQVFAGVCGYLTPAVIVEIHDRPQQVPVHLMTGECFQMLGIRPALGRLLTSEDHRVGAAHVAVMAYDLWRQAYDGRESVLGDLMNVDGPWYQIVGVAEPRFAGLEIGLPVGLFIPERNLDAALATAFPPRDQLPLTLLARRHAWMTVEAATAALQSGWTAWLRQSVPSQLASVARERYLKQVPRVAAAGRGPLSTARGRFQTPVLVLLALSGVLVLMTCVNVATLLLARGRARQRELIMRAALGASTKRLFAQAAIEGGLVLTVSVVVAVWIGSLADRVLVRMFAAASPHFGLDVHPDSRALAWTSALSVVTFFTIALLPVWRFTRRQTATTPWRTQTTAAQRPHARVLAVVPQVALTIVLVTVGRLSLETLRTYGRSRSAFVPSH
jgi:putative ABC transport system permease protein